MLKFTLGKSFGAVDIWICRILGHSSGPSTKTGGGETDNVELLKRAVAVILTVKHSSQLLSTLWMTPHCRNHCVPECFTGLQWLDFQPSAFKMHPLYFVLSCLSWSRMLVARR